MTWMTIAHWLVASARSSVEVGAATRKLTNDFSPMPPLLFFPTASPIVYCHHLSYSLTTDAASPPILLPLCATTASSSHTFHAACLCLCLWFSYYFTSLCNHSFLTTTPHPRNSSVISSIYIPQMANWLLLTCCWWCQCVPVQVFFTGPPFPSNGPAVPVHCWHQSTAPALNSCSHLSNWKHVFTPHIFLSDNFAKLTLTAPHILINSDILASLTLSKPVSTPFAAKFTCFCTQLCALLTAHQLIMHTAAHITSLCTIHCSNSISLFTMNYVNAWSQG